MFLGREMLVSQREKRINSRVLLYREGNKRQKMSKLEGESWTGLLEFKISVRP